MMLTPPPRRFTRLEAAAYAHKNALRNRRTRSAGARRGRRLVDREGPAAEWCEKRRGRAHVCSQQRGREQGHPSPGQQRHSHFRGTRSASRLALKKIEPACRGCGAMQAPGRAATWFRMAVLMWLLPFASLSSFTQGSAGGDGRRMQAQDRNPGGLGGAERVGVFLRGASTNARTSKVLADLAAIKRPNSVFLPTRVEGGQMQGHAFVEKTCGKMRASMYGFVSHTKKRPDHLVLGRLFTGQVLDSFEFRVLAEGPPLTSTRRLPQLGSMTAFVFLGKFWQSDRYLTQLKNYLIDCFGIRHQQKNLLMDRIETVLVCAAHNETHITLKQYLISSPDDVTAKGHQGEMTLNASLPDLALELVAAKLADAGHDCAVPLLVRSCLACCA